MVRRYSLFKVRRRTQAANLPGSPANITPAEQRHAIEDTDQKLAYWNRRYASRIVHNATPQKKFEARTKLIELENSKRALQNMQPVIGAHVARAEKTP